MTSELEESKTRLRRLFIVQSWPFVQSSLALLHQLGDSNGHDFLSVEHLDLKSKKPADQETAFVLREFGHSLVTRGEAQLRTYDEVHLSPSHVLGTEIDAFLSSLVFSKLVVHGDNFKNTVFVSPRIAAAVDQIIKFGLNLEETVLQWTKISREAQRHPVIVSFLSVQKTWQAYADALNWRPRSLPIDEFDLLVCERYWGATSYQMKPESDPLDYLSRVLDLGAAKYRRIIFRPTPVRYSSVKSWESATIKLAKLHHLEYTTWDKLVTVLDVPATLNHPEAQFFLGGLANLGGLFAFDGSLSLVIGSLSERTRVHWADGADTREIFEESRMGDIVSEQSRWMRLASFNSTKLKSQTLEATEKVTTDGTGYHVKFLEPREEQFAAKVASFSWRITKPLRFLGKFFMR